MSWAILALLIILAACVALNIRVVREDERLVVFRSGHFHRVVGPGLALVYWGIETASGVELTETLPEWHGLSEPELARRLEHLAETGQLYRSI